MRVMLGLRVMLALLVAVLLPLGQAHCALTMSHPSGSATIQVEHDDGDAVDCCPESAPVPASPAQSCCCDYFQIPIGTAAPSSSIEAPASIHTAIAIASAVANVAGAPSDALRLAPDARSGSPPDTPANPRSPRGPPQSA